MDEPSIVASAEASPTPKKMSPLLRKWLRRLARVTRVLAICLTLATAATAIWGLTSLNGLPDIGDPIDVKAFRTFSVPNDQNAFTFLRRAYQTLTPWPELPQAVNRAAATVSWSQADPTLQAWVEANGQAIDLFQQGADQPDATLGGPSTDVRTITLSSSCPFSL